MYLCITCTVTSQLSYPQCPFLLCHHICVVVIVLPAEFRVRWFIATGSSVSARTRCLALDKWTDCPYWCALFCALWIFLSPATPPVQGENSVWVVPLSHLLSLSVRYPSQTVNSNVMLSKVGIRPKSNPTLLFLENPTVWNFGIPRVFANDITNRRIFWCPSGINTYPLASVSSWRPGEPFGTHFLYVGATTYWSNGAHVSTVIVECLHLVTSYCALTWAKPSEQMFFVIPILGRLWRYHNDICDVMNEYVARKGESATWLTQTIDFPIFMTRSFQSQMFKFAHLCVSRPPTLHVFIHPCDVPALVQCNGGRNGSGEVNQQRSEWSKKVPDDWFGNCTPSVLWRSFSISCGRLSHHQSMLFGIGPPIPFCCDLFSSNELCVHLIYFVWSWSPITGFVCTFAILMNRFSDMLIITLIFTLLLHFLFRSYSNKACCSSANHERRIPHGEMRIMPLGGERGLWVEWDTSIRNWRYFWDNLYSLAVGGAV